MDDCIERDLKRYLDSGSLHIRPMSEERIRENGLDLRFSRDFTVMTDGDREPFDVRGRNDVGQYYDIHSHVTACVILPYSRCLTHTLETVALPKDLMGFCELRSSYARLGLSIPPTIIDAGFEGQLTIEIVGSAFPVKVCPFNRFLHVVFSRLTVPAVKPYAGKYLPQRGRQQLRVGLPSAESKDIVGNVIYQHVFLSSYWLRLAVH